VDRQCLLQVLALITELGRISQQWDRSEITSQNFKDRVQQNLKQLLLLVGLPMTNLRIDHPLVDHLRELQSEQELR